MTEDEIAAGLAAKVADEPPAEPTTPAPPKPDEEFLHNNLELNNGVEKQRWLDFFEVPSTSRYDGRVDDWLRMVLDWARDEAGSSEPQDLLRVISDQERVLGTKLKPDRLMTLARFATIRRQRLRLIEEERAMYG